MRRANVFAYGLVLLMGLSVHAARTNDAPGPVQPIGAVYENGRLVSWSPPCYWDSCAPVLVRDTRDRDDSGLWIQGGWDTIIVGTDTSYSRHYDHIPAPDVPVFKCQHGQRWQWDFPIPLFAGENNYKYDGRLWRRGVDLALHKQSGWHLIYPDSFVGPVKE